MADVQDVVCVLIHEGVIHCAVSTCPVRVLVVDDESTTYQVGAARVDPDAVIEYDAALANTPVKEIRA